jgi:ankyrin repeat protein
MKNFLLTTSFVLVIFSFLTSSHSFGQKIKRALERGDTITVDDWIWSRFEELNGSPIEYSFLITSEDMDSATIRPLVYASLLGEFEVSRLFIEYGKFFFKDYRGLISEALAASIQHNNIDFISLLLEEGADVNTICKYCNNNSPITISLAYQYYDIYQILFNKGAKLINLDAGFDLIHTAAGCDSIELLIDLVENYNLDVNQVANKDGSVPIMHAISKNQIKNVEYLVSKNADISSLDYNNENILHYCYNLDAFKYAEELLKVNNIDFRYPDIFTILLKDNKDLFDYYINHFPEKINVKDDDARNALFYLLDIEKNVAYFYEKLRSLGLKLEKDKYHLSVLKYAKMENNNTIKKLIKDEK